MSASRHCCAKPECIDADSVVVVPNDPDRARAFLAYQGMWPIIRVMRSTLRSLRTSYPADPRVHQQHGYFHAGPCLRAGFKIEKIEPTELQETT